MQECAKLLSNLGFGDLMLVLTAKDFNLRILEECLVQARNIADLNNNKRTNVDAHFFASVLLIQNWGKGKSD